MSQTVRTTSPLGTPANSQQFAAESDVNRARFKGLGIRRAARRAFSLIEVVLVLVLMIALAAIAVPAVNWVMDSFAQKQVIEMVQAAALEARAEVMRQGTAAQLTVVEDSNANRGNARRQGGSSKQASASSRSSSVVLRFAPQTHENMFTDPELLESVDAATSGDGSGTKKGRTQSIFELPPGWRILNRLPTQALLPPSGDSNTTSQREIAVDDESTVGGSPIVLAILLPSGEVGSNESAGEFQPSSLSMSEDQALPFASRDGSSQLDGEQSLVSEDSERVATGPGATGRKTPESSQDWSSDSAQSEVQESRGLYLIGPKGQAWLMSFSRWTGELVMKEVAMSDRTDSDRTDKERSLRDEESWGGQEETLNASSDSSAAVEPSSK